MEVNKNEEVDRNLSNLGFRSSRRSYGALSLGEPEKMGVSLAKTKGNKEQTNFSSDFRCESMYKRLGSISNDSRFGWGGREMGFTEGQELDSRLK